MRADDTQDEVRVSIDADFLKKLQNKLGLQKSTDVARVAFTLLDWASEETANNRMILSTTREGSDAHRLVMTELNNIKRMR